MIMDQVREADCGVVTDHVRNTLLELGRERNVPLIYADSRKRIGLYRNMLIKCNERETLEAFGLYDGNIPPLELLKECGFQLASRTGRTVFITMGDRGQMVIDASGEKMTATHIPAVPISGDIDICGAGDATSSALVGSLCVGALNTEAVIIGNLASSVTIKKIGQTGTATSNEILAAWDKYEHFAVLF
jgi:bifunctional ADP-heptose synthase (sugar kinase/adenylyltransferase)